MKIPALRFTVALLIAGLVAVLGTPVYAGMIGTQEILAEQTVQTDRDKVHEFLDRANVQQQLQVMDVPAALARERVDAMTPAEVATLAQRIDAMPAAGALSGNDFVIILLVALLVVLIL